MASSKPLMREERDKIEEAIATEIMGWTRSATGKTWRRSYGHGPDRRWYASPRALRFTSNEDEATVLIEEMVISLGFRFHHEVENHRGEPVHMVRFDHQSGSFDQPTWTGRWYAQTVAEAALRAYRKLNRARSR